MPYTRNALPPHMGTWPGRAGQLSGLFQSQIVSLDTENFQSVVRLSSASKRSHLRYFNMAGGSDAADAVKPFDWREIEDEDELSFGSEYESDGNVDADADTPAPQSEGGVGVAAAAQSIAPSDQHGVPL